MNTKVKCIVVDDEPLARELIETHIANVTTLENIASCASAMDAFDALRKNRVELMFLDIQMPLMTGLDFLRGLKDPPKVIITTAFRNYALDGYEFDVVDYLLKPVTFERFFRAIEKYNVAAKALSRSQHESPASQEFILLKSNKKHFKVLTDDILFIESLKDYVSVHTTKDKLVLKQPLSEIEALLMHKSFLRIHRSYIINLKKLTAFSASDVEIGDRELPIGSSYRDIVQQALAG